MMDLLLVVGIGIILILIIKGLIETVVILRNNRDKEVKRKVSKLGNIQKSYVKKIRKNLTLDEPRLTEDSLRKIIMNSVNETLKEPDDFWETHKGYN